jgi:hypothetical protein
MPKTKISEFDVDPANNTDINSINIAEGCAPSGINNAIRQLMSDLKEFQTGAASDPLTVGGVATFTAGTVSAPAITTAGDTNTGIYFPAADTIGFAEGGVEALRINANGQTATSIAGTASLPSFTRNGDENTGIFFPAADTIAFAEGGVEAMRIDSSGNVGIGTSSPSSILSLRASSPTINFITTAGDDTSASIEGSVDTGTGGKLVFITKRNGNTATEKMRIDSSGNVGIGTSSPADKLVIAGGNLLFSGSNFVYSYGGGTSAQVRSGINLDGTNTKMEFYTAQAEAMRIDSSGNLLVGQTSSDAKIAVTYAGGGSLNGLRLNTPSAGTSTAIQFVYNATTQVGTITTTTSVTAYNTSSDYRLKDNQAPLTGSGAFIDALQPKTWIWNIDGSVGVGFIAHEVQAVSPNSVVGEKDAVDAEGKPVMQAMEYGSAEFIANIIAELQDLRKRVAVLESK